MVVAFAGNVVWMMVAAGQLLLNWNKTKYKKAPAGRLARLAVEECGKRAAQLVVSTCVFLPFARLQKISIPLGACRCNSINSLWDRFFPHIYSWAGRSLIEKLFNHLPFWFIAFSFLISAAEMGVGLHDSTTVEFNGRLPIDMDGIPWKCRLMCW